MASTESNQPQQAVRFSSVNEEISPETSLQFVETLTSNSEKPREELSPEAQEEIRNLSMTLQKSRCQARRMENFSFEPVSLPASRVSTVLSIVVFAPLTDYLRLHHHLQLLELPPVTLHII